MTLPTQSSMQALIDQYGEACTKRDLDRITFLRRNIDSRLNELFKMTKPTPQAPKPTLPPPPPKPRTPPTVPPGPCKHCKGTGRVEEGNAILWCRECNGTGKDQMSKEFLDTEIKRMLS